MLWEGKWIIVATTLTVLGSVAVYTYSQTPVYETSTTVMIKRDQTVVPGISTTGRQVISRLSNTMLPSSGLQSEVFTLNRSRDIRRRVAERLDTMDVNPHTGEPPRILFGANGRRRTVAEITSVLRGVVQARVAGGREGVNAITLSVSSTSPGEAALLANQFAQAYKGWSRRQSRQATRSSRKFLEKQVKKFRRRVRRAERKLEAFMRKQGGVRLDQRTSRAVKKIAELQSRRDQMKIRLDMKRARLETQKKILARIRPKLAERLSSGVGAELERIQKKRAEVKSTIDRIRRQNPNITVGGTSPQARSLARLRKKENRLEQQSDSLASAYVEEALAVEGITSMLERGKVGRSRGLGYVTELQKKITQLQIDVSGLEAQLSTLNDQIDEYQQRLDTLPTKQFRLAQLQRDRRAAENLYGFLRQKLQEIRIAEQSEGSYVELLQPAGVPTTPVSPDRRRNLLLGLFLGLLGGIGLTVLRERLNTRLQTPEDLEAMGENVLGIIPSMAPLVEAEFDGADEVEVGDRFLRSTVVMLTNPDSAAAEAYRQLRVNLSYARPDAPLQSLIVTSPERGEGKTTTAINLAIAGVRSGQRVALVDADLRKPRIHTYLGEGTSSPGLTEVLFSESSLNITTDIDNLLFLPSGKTVPNPSELLGSNRMKELVVALKEEVDLVILDTPPLLLFSDTAAVAPQVDGALLVASANETDQRAYERARSKLESVRADIVGSVMNRFDPERGTYGYYYEYYGQGYGYENGSKSSWLKRTFTT